MGLGIITMMMRKVFPKKWHMDWLNIMLWGAVTMLALEHIAHGEIILYPPFLTAGLFEIMPEMLAVGGPMAIFSVTIWAGMVLINDALIYKKTTEVKVQTHQKLGHI